MAREYFCAYHSILEALEPLNDAERGRLFTACLTYSKTGEVLDLRGNERFVFPGLKGQIDRDKEKYGSFLAKQSDNGKKGGRPPKPNETQKTQPFSEKPKKAKEKEKEKEKTKEKTKEKENLPPLSPPLGGYGAGLTSAFSDWLAYKAERRQGYKPTGLKSLTTRLEAAVQQYGEDAVTGLIRECMANGYQGIIWDRLERNKGRAPGCGSPGARAGGDTSALRSAMAWMDEFLVEQGDKGGEP